MTEAIGIIIGSIVIMLCNKRLNTRRLNYMFIVNYDNKLLTKLKKAPYVSIDTETVSLVDTTIVGYSVAFDSISGFYVPIKDDYLDTMPIEKARNLLQYILDNCLVVFHNSSFDIPVLVKFGVDVSNANYDDTLIMANLINENEQHGLKKLVKKYFNYEMTELKEVIGTGKKQVSFDKVEDVDKKVAYACDDAKWTYWLFTKFKAELNHSKDILKLYEEVEKPLLKVVADMHINGIPIDVDQVFNIARVCREKVDSAEERLKILMGKDVNFNSPKQLKEFFIDKENMPIIRKSDKTNFPSVDKEVLEQYAETNGTAKLFLEYRKYNKILTTFIPALTPTNWKKDEKTGKRKGKIFASFNQSGTVSGRFSSSRPNMQNIPRDKKPDDPEYLGIRECFIPEEGHILIGADYSQIELRVLAHFSQDQNLKFAYINKKDVHQQTAEALGIDRQKAKTINFGLIYGMGNKTLAKQIKVPEDIAQEYIDKYFNTYQGVKAFWKNAEKQFKIFGFVQTISGRKRRRTQHFYHKDDYEQGSEIRSAINSIIQGTAADLIKRAMVSIAKQIKKYDSKLILTVHDEVLISCPIKYAKQVYAITHRVMVEAGQDLSVPIEVDIKFGRTWQEAHGDGIKLEELECQ